MAAAIVAHRAADIFRHAVQILQNVVNRFRLQVRMPFQGLVQIGDVSAMMFVVMDFHRSSVDIRFKCVVRVRQRGH